ncbi:stem cell self-renewal protein Piwi, partial [Polyplosphaeria fusca]
LAMKFNIKAGGLNHKLVDGVLDQYLPKRNTTVIFGADVTHPPAGSMVGYPSIACVVGSVDNNFQNYPGSMRLQAGRQERIEDLNEMVEERLEAWYAHRGRKPFPTSILFYRDGISESQFAECKEKEVAAIRTGFSAFATKHDNPTASCKVTFVVVGKRHHTRFFPPSKEESYTTGKTPPAGKAPIVNGNVQPGLFVDEVITAPEDYNFFLQSHSAIQGTARSAHYTVLEDKMGLISRNEKTGVVDGSNLANLTHNLCYSYARATTGVSYVAPAYIADRLCERGRVYLR